jgi:hypothetical protein
MVEGDEWKTAREDARPTDSAKILEICGKRPVLAGFKANPLF